jgi:hypothetical protein
MWDDPKTTCNGLYSPILYSVSIDLEMHNYENILQLEVCEVHVDLHSYTSPIIFFSKYMVLPLFTNTSCCGFDQSVFTV